MNNSNGDLSQQLDVYFQELDSVQAHVREILRKQQVSLSAPDAQEIQEVAGQQSIAVEQLQSLISRRAQLLQQAKSAGIPATCLRELANQLKDSNETSVTKAEQLQVKILALHQASQAVWVASQKAVLHYEQLVQLIANGGRKPMISSTGKHHNQGGAILDASV